RRWRGNQDWSCGFAVSPIRTGGFRNGGCPSTSFRNRTPLGPRLSPATLPGGGWVEWIRGTFREGIMSKRTFLLGPCVAVLGLAFAFTDLALSTVPGVTRANYARFRPGMTLRDVEKRLGGPAGPPGERARRLNALFRWLNKIPTPRFEGPWGTHD